jgi:hypothetical protein
VFGGHRTVSYERNVDWRNDLQSFVFRLAAGGVFSPLVCEAESALFTVSCTRVACLVFSFAITIRMVVADVVVIITTTRIIIHHLSIAFSFCHSLRADI